MKLEELFEQYQKLSKDELVAEGHKAYSEFGEKMSEKGYAHNEIVAFATMLTRLAAGADRYGSEEELDLFQEVTGIKTDAYEFRAMTKNADDAKFVESIDEIVDSLNAPAKNAALRFAAIFFASDDHLSQKEKDLFKRLEA